MKKTTILKRFAQYDLHFVREPGNDFDPAYNTTQFILASNGKKATFFEQNDEVHTIIVQDELEGELFQYRNILSAIHRIFPARLCLRNNPIIVLLCRNLYDKPLYWIEIDGTKTVKLNQTGEELAKDVFRDKENKGLLLDYLMDQGVLEE